jgi:excisionase family DNA binding protein
MRRPLGNPRDPLPDNPDLWTLTQAADFLGVSRTELLGLIREGALRYVQRGIRFRIHRNELERYREQAAGEGE